MIDRAELVERIWARDATVWTGGDEAQWLGWLDEPWRMEERLATLEPIPDDFDDVVLLGMGGSSLAPLVLANAFGRERFHVLDSTHPRAVHALDERVVPERTLYVAASKSGTTIETRSHLEYFRQRGRLFGVITDPGSELEALARENAWPVWHGEPTIGGRYSALSPFGMVAALLMDVDVERALLRAREMAEACRLEEGNPGLELGLALARESFVRVEGDFGLWAEQLVAESTGKHGKGIVPVRAGGTPFDVELADPYELAQEFFRWEFATAVAGAILGINPFDQPNVQEAKDRTSEILKTGRAAVSPEGRVDELLAEAKPPEYIAIQAFVDPAREAELEPLLSRARETGCPVAVGLGPRYLHSTGQLHKGGPALGRFIQVVDDLGDDIPIPGRGFGFRTLIAAQAAGDYAALQERGRPIVRVRLEEL